MPKKLAVRNQLLSKKSDELTLINKAHHSIEGPNLAPIYKLSAYFLVRIKIMAIAVVTIPITSAPIVL